MKPLFRIGRFFTPFQTVGFRATGILPSARDEVQCLNVAEAVSFGREGGS